MADMMMFPDTVEEFMEQYKITDTEQIYTNGSDLVPIFRMKQWFEHAADVAPVRHGRWERYKQGQLFPVGGRGTFTVVSYSDWFRCSECGVGFEAKTFYCPNCGAKMDLEENE